MIDIEKVRKALYNANLKGSRSYDVLNQALTELERLQKREVAMKVKKERVYSGYNSLDDGHKIMATNYNCPICNTHQTRVWDGSKLYMNKVYCDSCGQRLDWSDEK